MNTWLTLQSVIMESKCLLLILVLYHFGFQQVTNFVPTAMIGDIPPKGQPYQIVRIIEYIVPYSENLTARSLNADSFEIIYARTTTQKPMISRFLVKLQLRNIIKCTGALIAKRLVLSSSNCFSKNPKPNDYTILAGRRRIYKVEKIIVGSGINEDLALLVLKVASGNIQPVPLCSTSLKQGDNVTMYMSKKRLSFLRTQIIANRACKQSYAMDENVFITASMLCAQNTAKLQDCQTAKGDLLLHKDRLCGINIYGSHCFNGSLNGDLYANIFKSKKYLENMIKHFA